MLRFSVPAWMGLARLFDSSLPLHLPLMSAGTYGSRRRFSLLFSNGRASPSAGRRRHAAPMRQRHAGRELHCDESP